MPGPESTERGDSSEPTVGSNFEFNALRQARNIQTQCAELMQQLDGVHAERKKYRKDIQGRFLDAIEDLDERIFLLSERAPENTPALRGAFYDAAQAHDLLIHKYHMVYDNFSGREYTPYMSRDAYVNRPMPTPHPVPQNGPGNRGNMGGTGGSIPFGGFMHDDDNDDGGSMRALAGIPMIPETALASAAAASLIKTHQKFKNWYNSVVAFENVVADHMLKHHIHLPPKCKALNDWLDTNTALDIMENPQTDMLDLLARSN